MKVTIVGTGYVGLVQGVILANFGINVICFDTDQSKIAKLEQGIIPIYEPGLKEIMDKNVLEGRLSFTNDYKIAYNHGQVIFIAVGTPPQNDGSADLSYVAEVAKQIGSTLKEYKVIVNKSTVPVGTGKLVKKIIQDQLNMRNTNINFDVVSNPEFLREGCAVNDCLHPNRVVIGVETEKAKQVMQAIYNVLFINQVPFVFTNIETAEMIKYASNAFLAVKISFINEIALLAEKVGADTQVIARAMGMDGRISPKFLHCGPGYGGSCFPKDTKALINIGQQFNEEMMVVSAAVMANEKQKSRMVDKILDTMGGNLSGKTVGILGLSFKPDTDDMRDAPAIDIIEGLVRHGAKIKAYCPKGMEESKWRLSDLQANILYCNDEYDTAIEADAMVLITEWNQFRGLDLELLKNKMKDKYFFDLRNVFSKSNEIKHIFNYYHVG